METGPWLSPHFLGGIKYETKEIAYSVDLLNRPVLLLNRVLIHELCHAVLGPCGRRLNIVEGGSDGHGKRWKARMEKAAQVAEAIGYVELAQALRDDIDVYDPDSALYDPPLDAITCYKEIRRLVRKEPDWSFEDIMYWVGRDFRVPDDRLIKKFKKCRQVFEKAKKQVKDVASVRDEP